MLYLIRDERAYRRPLLLSVVCLVVLTAAACSPKKVVSIPTQGPSPAVVRSPASDSEARTPATPEEEEAAGREEIREEILPPTSPPAAPALTPPPASPPPVAVEAPPVAAGSEPALEEKTVPAAQQAPMPWPEVEYARKRFGVYERERIRWDELAARLTALDSEELQASGWPECHRLLTANLDGYRKLEEMRASPGGMSAGAETDAYNPWLILQQDIDYLEGNCAEIFAQTETGLFRRLDAYGLEAASQAEQAVGHVAETSGYEQAIAAFRSLREMAPAREMPAAVRKLYANALLRTGQLEEAAGVFREILALPGAAGDDEWRLRRQMADILLATGRVEEARSEYEAIAGFGKRLEKEQQWAAAQLELLPLFTASPEEAALYLGALRPFISSDGRSLPPALISGLAQLEEKYPESAFTRQARNMNILAGEQAGEWVGTQLVEADRLFDEKQYREAKAVLDRLLALDLPPRLEEAVLKTMDEILLAEKKLEEEQQQILLQALNSQWEKAMNLLDQQLYPQAIEALSALKGTDYEEKARLKIVEVSNLAATDMRRQAADLFVRAGKTADPALKRELMLESRRLLQEALARYPEVNIVDKLRRNLEVVEEQIRLVDPSLLTQTVVGNDSNDSLQAQKPPVAAEEARY